MLQLVYDHPFSTLRRPSNCNATLMINEEIHFNKTENHCIPQLSEFQTHLIRGYLIYTAHSIAEKSTKV